MKSSNIKRKMIGLLVVFVAAIFVFADLPASAQNTNSSTTTDSMQTTANTNMNTGRRRRARRQRRRARRRARNANADAATTTDANANVPADTSTPTDTSTNMSGGTAQSGNIPGMGTFGDIANLSGTYTGTINYPDGGMTGEATLTITENTFTVTAGSATASGTLSARSWPGYTALSMRFGDTLPATIVSTRAWHKGRSLRIQSVRGETRSFTFNGRSQ